MVETGRTPASLGYASVSGCVTVGGYFLKRPLVTTPPGRYTLLTVDYVLIVGEASHSVR
jgi:hypothetical protein